MLVRGATVLAVVTGAVALGAILGTAADPEMKQPPEPPWQGALEAPVDDAGYRPVGATDPSPYPESVYPESPYPDSYAPSWADEEFADWEPDYPAWTYGDLARDLDEDLAAPPMDEQPLPRVPETAPPEAPQPALPPEPQIAGKLAALY